MLSMKDKIKTCLKALQDLDQKAIQASMTESVLLMFDDFKAIVPTEWVINALQTGVYSDFMGDWIYAADTDFSEVLT